MTVEFVPFAFLIEWRRTQVYLGVPLFELMPWLYRWLESAVEDL